MYVVFIHLSPFVLVQSVKSLGYELDVRGYQPRHCISFTPQRPGCSSEHPASYHMRTGVLSTRVNLYGHEANHATPTSIAAENAWNDTSTPPTRLRGTAFKPRDNVTFV
jgi:hypothetical protein